MLTAEFFAALPTVRKSWKAPETETWTVFFAGFVSSVLTLLTVTHWTFPTYALSSWITLQSATEVAVSVPACHGCRLLEPSADPRMCPVTEVARGGAGTPQISMASR